MKKLLLLIVLVAATVNARPLFKDTTPTDNAFITNGVRIDVIAKDIFRIRKAWTNCWTESGLNRYGIIQRLEPVKFTKLANGVETECAVITLGGDGTIKVKSKVSKADLNVQPKYDGKKFAVRFSLTAAERIYGLGDASRDNIMRRGQRYEIWIRNNLCNIPIPMTISSEGWGMLLNSTWRNVFDVGKSEANIMSAEGNEGDADAYIFVGNGYPALLEAYTRLTGRSALLPIWGYGFTYVANQNIDQYNVINECMQFRDRGLPCDVYGLEPGWMERFYDKSIYKEWNTKRFYFPYWAPKGAHTWISAMKRMGMKLSLWLCCDYDLFRYEEQCAAGEAKKSGRKVDIVGDVTETWEDDRITGEKAKEVKSHHKEAMYRHLYCPEDTVPDGMLPWFEHLKKFVDQGAQCFKLDGSNQFGEHPNRAWANGMTDEEAHNLYSCVYDKQMARGYEDYTGRRAMVYSAGGYAGVQQFVATWAGDTGGGTRPLVSLLNLAASGHSNQSCDMSIFNIPSLHFGFLQTWSQQNNWDYWYQPWLQDPEGLAVFKQYAELRYRLLPYIYTAAAKCARTGWPVMQMLPLVWPEIPRYDNVKTTYLFGPDLLVSVFDGTAEVPPGKWFEWRTGEEFTGPKIIPVKTTREWGGAMFVRAGAIIPMLPVQQHVENGWCKKLELHVWLGADGKSELYEDDGISLGYREGKFATTALTLEGNKLTIGARKGTAKNLPTERDITVIVHENGKTRNIELGTLPANKPQEVQL